MNTDSRLNALEALDKADSDTDKTDNDERQNERVIDDSTDERADPRNSGRNERTDIPKDGCNGSGRRGIKDLPSYWN